MAVSTRMAAPNYKVFEPDALDQIYAQKSLDPIMGGIAYAMGAAHKGDEGRSQQEFTGQQDQYNKMAAGLDAMDIQQKQKEAILKAGTALVDKGEDPTNINGMEDVYKNPGANLLPGLLRDALAAKAFADRNKGSGGGGGPMTTVAEQYTDDGTGKTVTVTRKGRDVPIPVRPKVDPTDSTPIVKTPEAAATSATVNQQQIAARAKAAVGPDAVMRKQIPEGTVWTDKAGTKMAIFSPDGKQLR